MGLIVLSEANATPKAYSDGVFDDESRCDLLLMLFLVCGKMTDTLRGLSYMHELKPNPIAHGDIKSVSIYPHKCTTISAIAFEIA